MNASEHQKSGSNLSSVSLNFERKGASNEPAAMRMNDFQVGLSTSDVPELDNEFEWDFIGDFTHSADRIKLGDDPRLESFVARFKASERLLKGNYIFVQNKAYVPLDGLDYLTTLAKYKLFTQDEDLGWSISRFVDTGNPRNRRPQVVKVEDFSHPDNQKFLAAVTIGTSDPPQGVILRLKKLIHEC
jgi:hypothetical protein